LRPGSLCIAGALLVLSSPLAARPADAEAGRAKASACVVCHGELGVGQAPDAPHLAAQPEVYLVAQLKAYRSGKRVHEVMNVMAKPLTDADIADMAAWYASVEIKAEAPKR
jgi:cytochrome c553